MRCDSSKLVPWLPAVALFAICGVLRPALAAEAEVDYQRDIRPILAAHCVKCHGPDEQNGELRLDTAPSLLKGGNQGPAIVPGDPQGSRLLQAVTGTGDLLPMPPEDEGPPLSPDEIELLRRWIEQGAPHSPEKEPGLPPTTRRQSDHWAFQPITNPEIPLVNDDGGFVRNPIDAFILAELQKRGVTPSPTASKETLIRRVSIDLTGLPPTLEEVDAFVNDGQADAYERLVDRLLASPHYGERWARWWLDQARYADSDGYSNDSARVMWKYRDWLIEAFNRDLPFDQFIIQQLAGDLLPEAGLRELIATGFHRNTQTYSEGDSATEEYRVENVVDRVHTTGVVLLGLTLGCARCHDHKFDPISQTEFFQLFAFFNSQDEPTIDVPTDGWEFGESPADGEGHKTTSLVMKERSEPRETHVHVRGDFLTLGRLVEPEVPQVLPALSHGSGRSTRLELAKWLMSPENPLTSRVIANRIWQALFGRGLVETDDDFGTQGARPTHPELLDWLATTLQRQGWSLKSLHRLIVTAGTYRQSSVARPEMLPLDPRNELVARQNRLRFDAELIRDAALSVSGLLSRKIGGPSVFPPQPAGALRMTQHADREWIVSIGEDRYRRGMYTFIWRLAPHPMLTAFNAPEGSVACTRRTRANTPVQALTLLNDEAFVEAAQALALRTMRDVPTSDDRARLEYVFRLCLSRAATDDELSVLLDLLRGERANSRSDEGARWYPGAGKQDEDKPTPELIAWTAVARSLLNTDEFITRE